MEAAIKQMTEEKARTGGVLRLTGEGGIRLKAQLISNIHAYQTGEWPKDFTEVTVNDLKKKPKLQNSATIKHDQSHRTYSQDSSRFFSTPRRVLENPIGLYT